jgi:hypothetical protein
LISTEGFADSGLTRRRPSTSTTLFGDGSELRRSEDAGLLRALAAEFFALANKPADSVSILEEQVEPSKQSNLKP